MAELLLSLGYRRRGRERGTRFSVLAYRIELYGGSITPSRLPPALCVSTLLLVIHLCVQAAAATALQPSCAMYPSQSCRARRVVKEGGKEGRALPACNEAAELRGSEKRR